MVIFFCRLRTLKSFKILSWYSVHLGLILSRIWMHTLTINHCIFYHKTTGFMVLEVLSHLTLTALDIMFGFWAVRKWTGVWFRAIRSAPAEPHHCCCWLFARLLPDSGGDAMKSGFSGQDAYSFVWMEEMCWLLVRLEQKHQVPNVPKRVLCDSFLCHLDQSLRFLITTVLGLIFLLWSMEIKIAICHI